MKKKHFFFSPCQVLLPLLTGQPLSPEKLEGVTEELNVVLKQFEEKFLQDKPFIVGNEISLADLVALVELMQVNQLQCCWICKLGCGQARLQHHLLRDRPFSPQFTL